MIDTLKVDRLPYASNRIQCNGPGTALETRRLDCVVGLSLYRWPPYGLQHELLICSVNDWSMGVSAPTEFYIWQLCDAQPTQSGNLKGNT